MYYEMFDELCKFKDVRPGTVARETGISTATITAWKQGKYTPKADKLTKIAEYFGLTLDEFIYACTAYPNARFIHDLRHYAASALHAAGVPSQYIQKRGGWSSDYVMKRVYIDTISEEEQRINREIERRINGILSE